MCGRNLLSLSLFFNATRKASGSRGRGGSSPGAQVGKNNLPPERPARGGGWPAPGWAHAAGGSPSRSGRARHARLLERIDGPGGAGEAGEAYHLGARARRMIRLIRRRSKSKLPARMTTADRSLSRSFNSARAALQLGISRAARDGATKMFSSSDPPRRPIPLRLLSLAGSCVHGPRPRAYLYPPRPRPSLSLWGLRDVISAVSRSAGNRVGVPV